MEKNKEPKIMKALSRETTERLLRPLFYVSEEEANRIEDALGIELIVEPTEEEDKFGISRFSMANSFINDAEPGCRLTMRLEEEVVPGSEESEETELIISGIKFVDFKRVKEVTERGREMAKKQTMPNRLLTKPCKCGSDPEVEKAKQKLFAASKLVAHCAADREGEAVHELTQAAYAYVEAVGQKVEKK